MDESRAGVMMAGTEVMMRTGLFGRTIRVRLSHFPSHNTRNVAIGPALRAPYIPVPVPGSSML